MIEVVEKYIKEKHKNQTRKNGIPYYNHPIAVKDIIREKGFDETYQVVALLHDVLEDTNGTEEEILKLTNNEVLKAVILLTKVENYNMDDYIAKIKENAIALNVKLADRLHNLLESIYVEESFRHKYIKETEKYYIELSKNTIFEHDIINVLKLVRDFDIKK